MFAMVLSIGLLVDDAIVVVENVERIMSEEGLSPREATKKSMDQITPALIGIGLVLSAVFGPMAFMGGSTGIIYQQFSVTVIASMLLSVLVALILTPVLCAAMLKPISKGHKPSEGGVWILRPFFRLFDMFFDGVRNVYVKQVELALRFMIPHLVIFGVIAGALGYLYVRLPTAYLPDEDQGMMIVMATLPSGSTLEQTDAVMQRVRRYFLEHEQDTVEAGMYVSGFGMGGQGQNVGLAFIKLKDWDLRQQPELKVNAIANRAMGTFFQWRDAQVFAAAPPAIVELGTSKGFDFQLQDRGGLGHEALTAARNQLLGMAMQDPRLNARTLRLNGMDDVPEYQLDVDWEKVGALGVPLNVVHDTVRSAFGSAYVNDFIQNGRVKRVYVQSDAEHRMLPSDIDKLYVRNVEGKMVPFTAFASGSWGRGSPKLDRYNAFPSQNIIGEAAPGRSSGEAMAAMEEIAGRLQPGIAFDWTGVSYQERMAGSQTGILYFFSVLVIFLCLAALYESWTVPISVLWVLPLGAIGGVIAASWFKMPNDVYFQIGMLTILGLTTKNAILIVQFAKARVEEGMGLIEATLEASKLRLRPIVMTSLAFGFGVLPLALAGGAGAGAQKAIGIGVVGGVVTSTILVVLFAPLFYVMIVKLAGIGKNRKQTGQTANEGHHYEK